MHQAYAIACTRSNSSRNKVPDLLPDEYSVPKYLKIPSPNRKQRTYMNAGTLELIRGLRPVFQTSGLHVENIRRSASRDRL